MTRLVFILVLLLASCGLVRAPPGAVIVDGIPVYYVYQDLPPGIAGRATHFPGYCRIILDPYINQSLYEKVHVIAHEYGHCADYFKLGERHNNIADQGCAYGQYYCDPAEGYAEAYSYTYIKKCGLRLSVFQSALWADNQLPCELPRPEDVTYTNKPLDFLPLGGEHNDL